MTEKVQILIVEDDLLIAEMLKEMLTELNYSVVGIAKNYAIAIAKLQTDKSINLCFLDINLEDKKSGIDVAREIVAQYSIPFIFLTSYSDGKTIAEAASLHPEAYLVKPFTPTDLLTTIEILRAKIKKYGKNEKQKTLLIKDGGINVKISLSGIKWLRSDNVYVELITDNKKFIVRTTLEKMLEDINDTNFIRTHRSYAVNLDHVQAVNGQYLMIGEDKIPLSRKFREDIRKVFMEDYNAKLN